VSDSEPRERIAAVQLEHVDGQLTNYDTGREECGCGRQGSATYREHLADAILALPGIAVVELPEPDYDGDDGDGGVGWGTGDNCVFASGGMVYDQCGEFSPAQAREIGLLRWLAAADYAEREQ